MFFDRKAVANGIDKATRKVLSRFGAFVRTGARSSIRTRKAVSRPGSPPSSHTGLLKRGILFGYDAASRSVVIGPMALRRASQAPALLEYGGRTRGRRRKELVAMTYQPRPYMGPAYEKEAPKLPAMWAGSVK
jgi:hypothetical protein